MGKMKQLVISLLTVMFTVGVSAQDVKVEFMTPGIVHIVKGQPTKTLVVTAKPQSWGQVHDWVADHNQATCPRDFSGQQRQDRSST